MSKIGEILNEKLGYSVTPKQWDDIVIAMEEYADWYVAKAMTELFSHAETFQGKQILDLNKVKNLTTPEHD